MQICDGCAIWASTTKIGTAKFCKYCEPIVITEIAKLRELRKRVDTVHIAKRLFRSLNGTPGVLQTRDIPRALRVRLNRAAVDEGITLRDLTLTAYYEYLNRRGK